jgi:hypothetical protein
MANSKIVFGGRVLIDLTADTVEEQYLLKGKTAHGKDGEEIVGTCEFDTNTTTLNPAKDTEILAGKETFANGTKLIGKMPNNGAVSGKISTKDGKYTVPQGFHDGSGTVEIDDTEKAKLIADNIREGVTILGVAGSMSGTEDAKPQAKEVTPTVDGFEVLPDSGYNYLSQVTVKPIPYTESANAAGGTTVTIA